MGLVEVTILWICVFAFAGTVLVTLLALIGVVKLGGDPAKHDYYLKRLFYMLIAEVVTACVTFFVGYLNKTDAEENEEHARFTAEQRAALEKAKEEANELLQKVHNLTERDRERNASTPAKPPQEVKRTAKVYATSDNPRRDKAAVSIPPGWKYVSHTDRSWTKNGDARYSVRLVKERGHVTSVVIEATADGRGPFSARNWVGAQVEVAMVEDR